MVRSGGTMEQTNENKTTKNKKSKWPKALLAVGLIVGAVYLIEWYTNEFATSCEALVPQVVQISKDNGTAQGNALVLDVVEVSEHSNKNGSLECSGLAILSNNLKQEIKFQQYQEYDKWWVNFEPTGLPQRR